MDNSWPENFKPILIGEKKFFKIDESLLFVLGVKIHVKKQGYKDLDQLLQKPNRKEKKLKAEKHRKAVVISPTERNLFVLPAVLFALHSCALGSSH